MTQEKINIAELLKACPKGMELDCTIFDAKVIYQGLSEKTPKLPIVVQTEHGFEFELTQYGQPHNIVGSKCVIFPKGKTTWEGFVPPCKFEVGDIVKHKARKSHGDVVTEIRDTHYILNDELALPFTFQDEYELVFNKFDISTLKPFESRVLVRDHNCDIWKVSFWGQLVDTYGRYKYDTVRGYYRQCIPYEGNEHLMGKTDDCIDFYNTWGKDQR